MWSVTCLNTNEILSFKIQSSPLSSVKPSKKPSLYFPLYQLFFEQHFGGFMSVIINSGADPGGEPAGLVTPKNLTPKLLMTAYSLFFILFYHHSHSLFSYFSFLKIGHFNCVFKPKKLSFVICNIQLLFHWVYFTPFLGHYIQQNICFYSLRSSDWEIFHKITVPQ